MQIFPWNLNFNKCPGAWCFCIIAGPVFEGVGLFIELLHYRVARLNQSATQVRLTIPYVYSSRVFKIRLLTGR